MLVSIIFVESPSTNGRFLVITNPSFICLRRRSLCASPLGIYTSFIIFFESAITATISSSIFSSGTKKRFSISSSCIYIPSISFIIYQYYTASLFTINSFYLNQISNFIPPLYAENRYRKPSLVRIFFTK